MNVTVKLFAAARDAVQQDEVQLELEASATVATLRTVLAEKFPALEPLLPQVLFAVGAEYVPNSEPLATGAEIACIPPVSGG